MYAISFLDLKDLKKLLSTTVKNLGFYLLVRYQGSQSVSKTMAEDMRLLDQRQMTSFSHWFPLPPKSYKSDAYMGPGGCCTCRRFQSQLKDPEIRKLQSFIRGYKPTYPIFAPQGDITFILLGSKHTCPLPWREMLSLFSKAVCYINILEKVVKS